MRRCTSFKQLGAGLVGAAGTPRAPEHWLESGCEWLGNSTAAFPRKCSATVRCLGEIDRDRGAHVGAGHASPVWLTIAAGMAEW